MLKSDEIDTIATTGVLLDSIATKTGMSRHRVAVLMVASCYSVAAHWGSDMDELTGDVISLIDSLPEGEA